MNQTSKKIIFIHNQPSFEKRIEYVLDFIVHHPFAKGKVEFFVNQKNKNEDLVICYGGSPKNNNFFIPTQNLFFNAQLAKHNELLTNQYSVSNTEVYSVETKSKPKTDLVINNNFQFDIIETIFFHVSRFEEWHYLKENEDEHGRMSSDLQFLVKNQLHQKPVIDELIFWFLNSIGFKIEKTKTLIRITHDIDFIVRKNSFFRITKSICGAIVKRGNLNAALRIWRNRKSENPFDTFDWMLRKEDHIEKVIYFLVGGKSKFDNTYDLNLQVVKKAIQLSKKRNYIVGIHPSYETWKDSNLFQIEKEKLEKHIGEKINCTRQHFLRFSFQKTPKIIKKLNLSEDSTLGFANRIGFRCGTGFSYRLYDFEKEKAFDFLETPLVVMDSALFKEGKNNPKKISNIWNNFMSYNSFNTKITFNFHNSRFYEAQINGIPLKELYESLF